MRDCTKKPRDPSPIGATVAELFRHLHGTSAPVLAASPKVSTLPRVDDILGGLRAQELILLGAPNGSWGDLLICELLNHFSATHVGTNILIFYVFDQGAHLGLNLLCNKARVNPSVFKSFGYKGEAPEAEQIKAAASAFSNFRYVEGRLQSAEEICFHAKSLHAKRPLSLVVVDKINALAKEETETRCSTPEDFSHASSVLKRLARDLDAPVLALCDLQSKAVRKGSSQLSDLDGSGALEQDADIVLLLSPTSQNENHLELKIAKNRNGATGLLRLEAIPEKYTIREV